MNSRMVLITGSTDGIGRRTAQRLVESGHRVVVHGRSDDKVGRTASELDALSPGAVAGQVVADLSRLEEVNHIAETAAEVGIDVLVNNAGVYTTDHPTTPLGRDLRFVVNTIAPYRLSRALLDHLPEDGRIVSLCSAAQSPVDLDALRGGKQLSAGSAYAQSKLALTMCSRHLAGAARPGQVVVAVNPGSLLATSMVEKAYGVSGKDVDIGAKVVARAATGDDFAHANGLYFDNDTGRFADPHPDALDPAKARDVLRTIDELAESRDR